MQEPRALITGASSGIGAEYARQLAAQGKDLILVARRMLPMEKLAKELREDFNVRIEVMKADLARPDTPAALCAEVLRCGHTVDYLVNNAGSYGPDLLGDRDWEAHRGYLELMMTSATALCHFFIPAMQERGYGRVVNVASVAGLMTVSGDYNYGPTKAYLVALSRALSVTLRGSGVHVTALCPGFTHTGFHASESLARMKKATPKFIWYDAEVVVRDSIRAVEKGRPVCISGRLYRWLIPILRTPLGRIAVKGFGVNLR